VSALLHKAQAARLIGAVGEATQAYKDLAAISEREAPNALLQCGLLAETQGQNNEASDFYGKAAAGRSSSRTDNPAELARRALLRLNDESAYYRPSAWALGDLLATALEQHDIIRLAELLEKSHLAIGPMGGHTIFEEIDAVENLFSDLLDSRVTCLRALSGGGEKYYLITRGWSGQWFNGDVAFLLTLAPWAIAFWVTGIQGNACVLATRNGFLDSTSTLRLSPSDKYP